jgi:hypothetical protein
MKKEVFSESKNLSTLIIRESKASTLRLWIIWRPSGLQRWKKPLTLQSRRRSQAEEFADQDAGRTRIGDLGRDWRLAQASGRIEANQDSGTVSQNPSGWNKVQGSLDRPKCRRTLPLATRAELSGVTLTSPLRISSMCERHAPERPERHHTNRCSVLLKHSSGCLSSG